MPGHPTRYYGTGDLHFIGAVCYHRKPFLGTAARRDLFLEVFEKVRRRYRLGVVGYVVMPDHFHLLVSEPQRSSLSTVVQAVKLGFSRCLLSPGQAVRPSTQSLAPQRLWQTRFFDFNVGSEHKRIEKLRYMHRNPVTAGLVDSPEKWRWSSFRFYLYGEPGVVRVNEANIFVMKRPPKIG